MKNSKRNNILFLALVTIVLFVGCSKDNNSGSSRTCNVLGLIPTTIQDNEDGTATITIEGESDVFDLEGEDFDTFADTICSGDLDLDFEI